jgi:hypothetical protein
MVAATIPMAPRAFMATASEAASQNRSPPQHRLFFGYDNERLIRATQVPVVVVPNVSRLG